MLDLLSTGVMSAAWCMALAGVLHLLPRLGTLGRRASEACTRAPVLDLVVAGFQIVPWVGGPVYAGWWGLLGAIIGQAGALLLWCVLHEAANAQAAKGPRIVKVLNRIVGPWRQYTALWATTLALPIFWFVRFGEVAVYPIFVELLGFPKYKHAEWINVSRQKFSGLVGHDLIWCLYCDWMTGVYALGGEMLRNVESFWCPIRFSSEKKCANCAIDFPDLTSKWTPANGTMEDVTKLLETEYAGGRREWFGHPARLTVEGTPPEPVIPTDQPV